MLRPSIGSRDLLLRQLQASRVGMGAWVLAVLRAPGRTGGPLPPAALIAELHLNDRALVVCGLKGVAVLVRATATALEQLRADPSRIRVSSAAAADRALAAAVLAAQADVAAGTLVSFFPLYRAVAQLAGQASIHPADLWWPHSSDVPGDGADAASAVVGRIDPAALAELESALLDSMRHPRPESHLRVGRACALLSSGFAGHAADPWLMAEAVCEALAEGALSFDDHLKRLGSRLLALGRGQGARAVDLPTLRHDLLFHCALAAGAAAGPLSPCLSRVCRRHAIEPLRAHFRLPGPDSRRDPPAHAFASIGRAGRLQTLAPLTPRPASGESSAALERRGPAPRRSTILDPMPAPAAEVQAPADQQAVEHADAAPERVATVPARGEPLPWIEPPHDATELVVADAANRSKFGRAAAEGLRLLNETAVDVSSSELVLPTSAFHWSEGVPGLAPATAPTLASPSVLEGLSTEMETIESAALDGASRVECLRRIHAESRVGDREDARQQLEGLVSVFGHIDAATRRMRAITEAEAVPRLLECIDTSWVTPAAVVR
jgi:hypothetical protein